MVLYSMIHNTVKLIDEQIGSFDSGKIDFFQKVAAGKQKASSEGAHVFFYLKDAALKRMPTPPNRKDEA
jgi:hypothetical protein